MAIDVQKNVADTPAVEICGLSKSYGANKALDNISFSVKKGEVMGFLGPNGAGKSTTMNILTGYLAPSGGSVKIDGLDIVEDAAIVRQKIGYLPEIPPLYTDMTVYEYLDFVYDLKTIQKKDKKAHLKKIMEKVQITHVKGRLIKNLSKGYRQRVGLAQALIGDPEVLILDEPTVGLDPKQILEIREVISQLGKNRTIILSTHILQEVSAVCDSFTIINHGKIVATGKIDELDANGVPRFVLRARGTAQSISSVLSSIEGISNYEERKCSEAGANEFIITAMPDTDIREDVFRRFAKADLPILSFGAATPSLEEMFMNTISSREEALQDGSDN